MLDAIIIGVLVLIVGGIGFYLYRAKRSGAHCIGCPHAKKCPGKCSGSCNMGNQEGEEEK